MSSESEDEDFLSADEGDSNDEESTKNTEEATSLVAEKESDSDSEAKVSREVEKCAENLEGLSLQSGLSNVLNSCEKNHERRDDSIDESCEIKETVPLNNENNVSNSIKTVGSLDKSIDVGITNKSPESHLEKSGVENFKELLAAKEYVLPNAQDNIDVPELSTTRNLEESPEEKYNRTSSQEEVINKAEKSSVIDTPVKPIKESKIKLKKPRERLGERLGTKKLGSRITKPLVGISSDSFPVDEGCNRPNEKKKEEFAKETEKNEQEESKNLLQDTKEDDSWGSWGGWGSTLINAASTLSKEVSRGVETVLESGIGAPDPVDLAREIVEQEKKLKQEIKTISEDETEMTEETKNTSEGQRKQINSECSSGEAPPSRGFGFGSLGSIVTGVSGALETASSKVLMGGLDTLEMIGRRTMDILQEGDPGLRKKRNFLSSNKPNLSLALREARERAMAEEEERSKCSSSEGEGQKKLEVSLALAWDNTEGPVHLEALSLVAKQCQRKTDSLLQDLPSIWIQRIQDKLSVIREMSTLGEEEKTENIEGALMEVTRDVQLPLHFNKVLTGWPALQDSLSRLNIEICSLVSDDFTSIQKDLYSDVTRYVAQVVGVTHKAAEMALITPDLDAVKLASQFQRLCGYVSSGLEKSADEVCEAISKVLPASDPEFNLTITNIYVQIAELNTYLEHSLTYLSHILVFMKAKTMARELGD